MPRYAAIDIGSNSVRLLVAELNPGAAMRTLAAERQVTRLGESVFRAGRISAEAMRFLAQSLAHMAATYRKFDIRAVRVVATSAVRDAANQAEFLRKASAAIGAPVEIISGQEESRLIHLGIQARWPHPRQRVLAIDVGGGSGEIIASENGRLLEAYSKPLGAVRLHEMFLRNDPPLAEDLERLDQYILEKLERPVSRLGGEHYDRLIVTSSTAAAVVCAVNGIPRSRRESADRLRASTAQVRAFYRRIIAADLAHRRKIPGVGPRRAEIIIGGTAVFLRALEAFGLPSMYYSAAGVRDGIVADLAARGVGREVLQLGPDQRESVAALSERFGSSPRHARKVAALAHQLFEALQPAHQLRPGYAKLLEAAAYLYDIGRYVNENGHHKHAAYLVENADLAGFTDAERHFLALLCRFHRKAAPATDDPLVRALPPEARDALLHLVPLLRLADNLERLDRVERLECQLRNGAFHIAIRSRAGAELEQWAAGRVAPLFRSVYGIPLVIAKVRATPRSA